jgi:hypothetical protein
MEAMHRGFPPPPNLGNRPVTIVRNVASRDWRLWLKPEWHCLAPVISFCEYTDSAPEVPNWFALDASRPVFAFASTSRPWTGTRGIEAAPEQGEHHRFRRLGAGSHGGGAADAGEGDAGRADGGGRLVHMVGRRDGGRAGAAKPFPAERMSIIATGRRQDAAVVSVR